MHERRRHSDPGARARLVVTVLLAALPVGFLLGRALGPAGPVGEVQAAPVPMALPPGVTRFHDPGEEVTCWLLASSHGVGGLSCLPDAWLASARWEADETL